MTLVYHAYSTASAITTNRLRGTARARIRIGVATTDTPVTACELCHTPNQATLSAIAEPRRDLIHADSIDALIQMLSAK